MFYLLPYQIYPWLTPVDFTTPAPSWTVNISTPARGPLRLHMQASLQQQIAIAQLPLSIPQGVFTSYAVNFQDGLRLEGCRPFKEKILGSWVPSVRSRRESPFSEWTYSLGPGVWLSWKERPVKRRARKEPLKHKAQAWAPHTQHKTGFGNPEKITEAMRGKGFLEKEMPKPSISQQRNHPPQKPTIHHWSTWHNKSNVPWYQIWNVTTRWQMF